MVVGYSDLVELDVADTFKEDVKSLILSCWPLR